MAAINRSVFIGTLSDNPTMIEGGLNDLPAFEFLVNLDDETKVRCVLASEKARDHCLSLHGMIGVELAVMGFLRGTPPYILVGEVRIQPRDPSIMKAAQPLNPS